MIWTTNGSAGTGDDESGGESSGQGATSTTGETTGGSSESGSSGETGSSGESSGSTGSGECVGDPVEMSDGWWISGCCLEPLVETTCADWCAAQGFGECLFVHTTNTGACEPYGTGINQLGVCDENPWETFPTQSLDGLSIRCVCDAP